MADMGRYDHYTDSFIQEPCEEYKRGWHDAIATALKETINYYTEDGVFSAIQEESLIGVGMSMPEPKKGHWEWLTEDKYRCSNCNHETRVDECINKPMYDFCPFCGCRMEMGVSE